MATEDQTKAKAENQLTLRPLLPLEYCRPERAAKLLNCEIEDLFHWAAIGAIKIYVNAAKAMDEINTVGVRLPKGRCEQVPDMRSCLSSGAMEQGSS